jgi:hypothetical protein
LQVKSLVKKIYVKREWPVWLKVNNTLYQIEGIKFINKDSMVLLSGDKEDNSIPEERRLRGRNS